MNGKGWKTCSGTHGRRSGFLEKFLSKYDFSVTRALKTSYSSQLHCLDPAFPAQVRAAYAAVGEAVALQGKDGAPPLPHSLELEPVLLRAGLRTRKG